MITSRKKENIAVEPTITVIQPCPQSSVELYFLPAGGFCLSLLSLSLLLL